MEKVGANSPPNSPGAVAFSFVRTSLTVRKFFGSQAGA